MGEYVNDSTEEGDINTITGEVVYTFKLASHAKISAADRAALRTAALSDGWTGLRAAWVAIDSRAGAWLDGMSAADRAALLRQARRPLIPAV